MEEVRALKEARLPDNSLVQVVKERENKLVGRLEVHVIVNHIGKGAPSRLNLVKALSNLYKKGEDLIVVTKILTEYGIGISKAIVHIYSDLNRLRMFEPEYLLRRHRR
ncbi:MAG: 30S ribosomal protein S24e [Desulfurococcales archaeon ex4484_204]|nr:MAG: 30S ribosomal protein S24e [Desulfurococcales archaeon ex4484_204]